MKTLLNNSQVTINLYVAGYSGLIGKELISIVNSRNEKIKREFGISFKLAGLINSKQMSFSENLENNKDFLLNLEKKHEKANLNKFIEVMIENQFKKNIFVDCTANVKIADLYEKLLLSGISVVTPNKIANSSNYDYYVSLKEAVRKSSSYYFYETNVGAGLPIIDTLNNILLGGDKVVKIEAILSGTLSFIFNSYKGSHKFGEVVKLAKEKGFTEPNPENDLTGLDVARKLLILIRECGLKYELKDLDVENLVPESARNSKNPEEFFSKLEKHNEHFEKIKLKAEQNGNVLRYIACYESGIATVKLKEVSNNHPFYNMEGSDNIVSFQTEQYTNPLVVKGAGAGAFVTASGVFADIFKAGRLLK